METARYYGFETTKRSEAQSAPDGWHPYHNSDCGFLGLFVASKLGSTETIVRQLSPVEGPP